MYCDVIVDVSNKQINKAFEYKIPEFLCEVLQIGHRVSVPFGSRKVLGFVVDIHPTTTCEKGLKSVYDVLDIKPIITPEFIGLARYMVKRYYSFYITCLKQMIPQALRVNYFKKIHLINKDLIEEKDKELFKDDYYTIKVQDERISKFKKYESIGAVEIIDEFIDKGKKKSLKMIHLKETTHQRSPRAKALLDYLVELNEDISKKALIDMGYSESSINTLINNGAIQMYDSEVYRDVYVGKTNDKIVKLNDMQDAAYQSVKKSFGKSETFLLHGVCGSGKTEIYLSLIEDVIKNKKEAIILVPEISLTPQMTQRFKARFHDDVAVLHSRLSNGERYDEWRRILNGHAHIVVGARSAIFAPFKNLGLIIIDEEHEQSYIQDTNPKYDAIDIALYRSKYNNCPLLLGSATPRISDYKKALDLEYTLLELRERANMKKEPISEVVDMREELKSKNKSVFSRALHDELKNTLTRGEQAILFINRRGYSSFVMCRECGNTIDCPNCNMSLTYHKYSNRLKCHHCGYEIPMPLTCPTCSSKYIKLLGDGTEKAVEEIKKEFPGVRVERVDRDTMNEKNSYQIVFDKFRNHEIDILIGTQIIAKGLDFPSVSLVGVLNADIGLKIAEYNAQEISYDLIEQVSGRAGRDKIDGKVIIQTYMPDNPVIKYASTHDYKGFYKEEIKNRNVMNYPPFCEYIEIMVSSKNITDARVEATKIKNIILKECYLVKALGPFEDYLFKVNNIYRYKISLKFKDLDLFTTLESILEMYQSNKDINISITRK